MHLNLLDPGSIIDKLFESSNGSRRHRLSLMLAMHGTVFQISFTKLSDAANQIHTTLLPCCELLLF